MKLAVGCLSAINPCPWQCANPGTLCGTCCASVMAGASDAVTLLREVSPEDVGYLASEAIRTKNKRLARIAVALLLGA